MEHPLVSVVAITRNHEEFCVEALDSIINQSYKNLELIILDAASTDRTLQIIDEWLSEKNLQALFLKEKELKPLPVNLNKALTFATGEYVQFISLDDVLLENKFNDQVELLLKNPDCVFSYSDCYLIDENNNCSIKTRLEFKKIESPPTGDVFQELLNLGYFTATPTILWNRLKLQEIGRFNEKYLMEDLEFIYRATLKFKVVYCDKITLKYRVLSSSLSHTPNARFLMEECEIKLKYLTFSKMPQQTV
jgi:glycosyltransferase involved in cell wall biosynthesis